MITKVYDKIISMVNKSRLKSDIKKLKYLGENTEINYGLFNFPDRISIGNNVYIGPEYRFYGRGSIIIEDGVIIGPRLTIHSSNHNYNSKDLRCIPYDEKVILEEVKIGQNVWMGDSVYICPGVTIGEGSVIGMNSVVSRDIPPYSIACGNPAKVVKQRDIETYEKLKEHNNIYLEYKNKFNINPIEINKEDL